MITLNILKSKTITIRKIVVDTLSGLMKALEDYHSFKNYLPLPG